MEETAEMGLGHKIEKVANMVKVPVKRMVGKFRQQEKPKLKLTEDKSDEAKNLDPDDPEARILRVDNQHSFEQRLNETFGLPLQERLKIIREALFAGFPNVRGEPIAQMRQNELPKMGLSGNFASAELVRNRLMPKLEERVDELHGKIKTLNPEEQAEAALRLASVLYTLAIPTHPYSDGNGQTLRVAALSYLHELAPEKYGTMYFPHKPGNSGDNTENNIRTPILRDLYELNPIFLFSDEERNKEWALRAGFIETPGEDEWAREVKPEELKEMFPTEESKETFRKTFDLQKQVLERLGPELGGRHNSQTNVHYFVDFLLQSKMGWGFTQDFILHPDIKLPDDRYKVSSYLNTADRFYSGVTSDIEGLLEPKEEHDRKYAEWKTATTAQSSRPK